ncbi:MAG: tRNA pseudouridine(13) synthase TruD, partial [Planctomycetaceae bacterium]
HHVARHRNKLRAGHLVGNRFSIVVRDVLPDAFQSAQTIAAEVLRMGAPNYYGMQRFGREGETLRCGLDLLNGRLAPHGIPKSRRRFLLRLALSAAQSLLFNQVVSDRVRDGLCHTVMDGDVVQLSRGRRTWRVQDAVVEQSRLDQGELLLTGPMFGPRMVTAGGQVNDREQRVLQCHELGLASFERFPRLTSGTRRPLLVRPGALTVTQVSEGLRFDFDLPSGAYATTLLREFQKDDVEQPGVPAQMSE